MDKIVNHGLYGYARIILYKILKSGGKSKHKNVFPYRQSFARKKCKTQEFAGEKKKIYAMSKEELRSYRLNTLAEPTDEMLEAIMLGVRETARRSSINARAELTRRFESMKAELARRKALRVGKDE